MCSFADKILLILLCISSLATNAEAQFTKSKGLTFPNSGTFECGILQLAPRDRDDDPVYKIMLSLAYEDENNKTIKSMKVTHWSMFGKVYTRDEQYAKGTLNEIPGKLEILWRGAWKKDSNVFMTGRLWNESNTNRWFYSEVQTRSGNPQMQLLSGCHSVDYE